jgi:hypothetical protein
MPVILANSKGRGQENYGSKPSQANSSKNPISIMPITKIRLVK